MIEAICKDTRSFNGEGALKYSKKAQELLGRIASVSPGSCRMWHLYAKLLKNNKCDVYRIIQCLQKAHRAAIQEPDWEKNSNLILTTLDHCKKLGTSYFECVNIDQTKTLQCLSMSKMALKNVITKTRQNKERWENDEKNKELIQKELNAVEDLYDNVIKKLEC